MEGTDLATSCDHAVAVDELRVQPTGLVCPQCKEPVAIVENRLPKQLVFLCPACGNRWSAEEPGAPRQ
jgi:predicted RNA-binding Zn-ribbon protein involved in translation (DUF1610 family)